MPLKKTISLCVICAFLSASLPLHAESVDDKFTQISPQFSPGNGEYMHGQGYGKLLMRIIVLGAVPQQGVHYMPEGTDLMFAIIYCGGKGDQTKLNGIAIRRRNVPDVIKVNLEDLLEEGVPIPKLVDGDVVDVPYNWKKDYSEFMFISGVFTSVTALILAIIALSHE